MVGDSLGEQASGTGMTNAEGRFSFTGLQASQYLVEVLAGDEVVASASATLEVGAMQASAITLQQSAPEGGGGLHPAAWVAIGAGAGLGIFLLALAACYEGGC